jgi:predicted RNase H-like HicB family nuclease
LHPVFGSSATVVIAWIRSRSLSTGRALSYGWAVSDQLHLTIRYSDAGDGWVTAQVAEIPGAISQGKTREEAKANVLDALDVLLTPDEQLAGESSGDDSESLTLTVAT